MGEREKAVSESYYFVGGTEPGKALHFCTLSSGSGLWKKEGKKLGEECKSHLRLNKSTPLRGICRGGNLICSEDADAPGMVLVLSAAAL